MELLADVPHAWHCSVRGSAPVPPPQHRNSTGIPTNFNCFWMEGMLRGCISSDGQARISFGTAFNFWPGPLERLGIPQRHVGQRDRQPRLVRPGLDFSSVA